jgi:hypothetical protein
MSMVGKFFHESNTDYYSTGQIVGEVERGPYFIVEYDAKVGTPPTVQHLIDASEMAEIEDGIRKWSFFDSREALQQWMDWLDSPASPKVVNLVRK